MILKRGSGETWFGAAVRYAALDGIGKQWVFGLYGDNVRMGHSERRSAYLALAVLGVVDDVEE